MIDTEKYEGHTEGKWNLTLEGHIVADNMTVVCNKYTKRIVETNHKDAQLIADAPLLLQEVKRLRSLDGLLRSMEKDGITASGYDHLLAEVQRLREAIADIAKNMQAADPSYLQGFIKDLLEVIE